MVSEPDSCLYISGRKSEKEFQPCRRGEETDKHPIRQRIGRCRERGRQVPNPEVERDMHDIRARLVDVEIKQRRRADIGDVCESESEVEAGHE